MRVRVGSKDHLAHRVFVRGRLAQRVRALAEAVLFEARGDHAFVVLGVDDIGAGERAPKGQRGERRRVVLVRVADALVVRHVGAHSASEEYAHRPERARRSHGRQRRRRRRRRAAEAAELLEDGGVERAARAVEAGARLGVDVFEAGDARLGEPESVTCACTNTLLGRGLVKPSKGSIACDLHVAKQKSSS